MELAADASVADIEEVARSTDLVNGGSCTQLVHSFTGCDVTPRAAMALGLHRIAERVGQMSLGSPEIDFPAALLTSPILT